MISAARPQPARHGLVQQPPIHQGVERIVWCADAYGIEGVVPHCPNAVARGNRGVHVAVFRNERSRVEAICPLAQEEDQFLAGTRPEHYAHV